ncbi:MAG: hypothetical protein GX631_06360 [Dehalococcoidales bacterium]|nr:hypothetical protein [Dehalococcoidales bacterium]
MVHGLRPYQLEAGRAILDSVYHRKGLTFCVEVARQGGKNELSACLELNILARYGGKPWNLIKCSPTFKPQTVLSRDRLRDRIRDNGVACYSSTVDGYIVRFLKAKAVFLSAAKTSNVVGHTAHLLLEVDEAQDVDKDKYSKEFRPMGSTTNVTTVLYGTPWDDTTLLEETKQSCYELEKKDGIRRVFRYDWHEIARHVPDYRKFVEGERARLGDHHPLFLTQYCLELVNDAGRLFSPLQREQLQGTHAKLPNCRPQKAYIAGIDLAGEAEQDESGRLLSVKPGRDSTVMTIAELDYPPRTDPNRLSDIRIVAQYCWTGQKHSVLVPQMIDTLRHVWDCDKVVVDATGVGQPVASFLKQALGSRIVPFTFTSQSKSKLGYQLLAAVDSGRLKMYASDGSAEYHAFWHEMETARKVNRPDSAMNFFVHPSDGHDDYLMSLALLVEAAERFVPRIAYGTVPL